MALDGPDQRGSWKIELESQAGARKSFSVRGGWVSGRKRGDRIEVLAHPRVASFFVLTDEEAEGWSAMIPGLIALGFLFGGGRLLSRALASPVGVLEDLREGFRG